MARKGQEELTAELERLALRAVRRSYDDLNGSLFRWKLKAPAFELSDGGSRLGRWNGGARSIELSRKLCTEHGWGTLLEVLKHEMAHQYVSEVLGVRDESDHGPVYRKVCEERGIDARATGLPEAPGNPQQDQVLSRIQKLLALAESSNEHEAQAATSAAQRLMLKHNIETLLRGGAHAYGFRHVGEPSGRVRESQRILAAILGDFFFVEVIWVPVWRPLEGKRGSVLEVCGTRQNLDLAEYVHTFLSHTAERLWLEYRRELAARGASHHQAYLSGVMSGFRERLERERRKNQSEGLVWVGDAELNDYFRDRHRHIRWSRYAARRVSPAYSHGREAGRGIVLHRGIRAQAANGPPRLLPGKRQK
ncbi:MAG TPA: DUF2786 domain-containing protein [Polyangiaceae bacterium]|nr:DUF2786 domain-containing protein [Polyangiaceae bacterium]